MDLVVEIADEYILDTMYPASMPRDDIMRQLMSISGLTVAGGYFLYISGGYFAYTFLFDKELMKHPKFLPNQMRKEIEQSVYAIPLMMVLMMPWFLAEVRGHTLLYTSVDEYGWGYLIFSVFLFLLFSDTLIYWIHRGLHHPKVYRHLHKDHHKWLVPTPFASHAFHPVDGFLQSLPYHLFIMVFPMHRVTYLCLFLAVNYWTISIHDEFHVSDNSIINGAAHHTLHHAEFNYNYGQYTTVWDRIGGSFKKPSTLGNHAGLKKE